MPGSAIPHTRPVNVEVRPMRQRDLEEAGRILRVAFGTFLGVPNPESFWADREYVSTRYQNNPDGALVAEIEGRVVGSNFAANWGSFGFFGPLTILPEYWNRGVAQKLLAPTMELFSKWGVQQTGLFTFSHSTKHVALYQKFGFWPRFLTAIMSKPLDGLGQPLQKFSELSGSERECALGACRSLTGSLHEGLDVNREILAVQNQKLGDTLLLRNGETLNGFAICHCGEGSEGGQDTCYIKFAAIAPGPQAGEKFLGLLDGCEALARERGLHRLEAGVNLSRGEAYRRMLARGFRTDIQGVAMHNPDSPAFNRAEVFIIDDWR